MSDATADLIAKIGHWLRAARLASGLTLRDVAAASGDRFRPTSVAGYERGERRITVDRFCALCDLYGVRPERLLAMALDAAPGADRENGTLAVRVGDVEVIGRGSTKAAASARDRGRASHRA